MRGVSANRPNVIIILADDFAYGDLGCFGNDRARTPALDALAGNGMRLTQHYSGAPVCAPARACLLTGRYPHRTGATDLLWTYGRERLSLDEVTLADVLRAEGYATGLVGKWHLGAFDPRYHPNRRGFDEFVGFHFALMDYWQWTLDRNGTQVPADGRYLTDVFTAEAIAFLRRHGAAAARGGPSRQPFFLYLAYNAPHGPLQAPESEIAPFLEAGLDRRTATIYAMNAVMDRGIGQVLEELERLRVAEDTLVLFSSDNGPAPNHTGAAHDEDPECAPPRFNAGLRGHKYLTYEGGIRVPCLVRWPAALPRNTTSSQLVHFADWLPTVVEAAGVGEGVPAALDGISMLATLRGAAPANGAPIRFWQWNRYVPIPRYNAAVRDGDWKLLFPAAPGVDHMDPAEGQRRKLVETGRMKYEEALAQAPPEPDRHAFAAARRRPPQLFNLAADPFETDDLSAAEPSIVARLMSAHDAWCEEVHVR